MPYMRINYITLRPGTKAQLIEEARAFLNSNDPEESGLAYILDAFDDEGGPSVGITVWTDKEKFEQSSQRWPKVMEGMAHLLEPGYRREEFELTVHNLEALSGGVIDRSN